MTLNQPSWRGRPLQGVLFDLDGTLLDTAADIAAALNQALADEGLAPFSVDEVARMVGRGSPMLIERAGAARGARLDDAQRASMLARFFQYYGEHEESNGSVARPYPGVMEALRDLHHAGMKLAVVTNKHSRFADALLRRLGFMAWIGVVVGGDTCSRRKPDPEPLLHACRELGIDPSAALMVGDSINDVSAARAAHIPVVCVPYGYNEGADPRLLPCDAIIETLADLAALLRPAP